MINWINDYSFSHADKANIGDSIKSFDFAPASDRPDQYVIGKVIAKGITEQGFEGFTIEVTFDTWQGKRVGSKVMVPMQTFMGEYAERVSKVD